MNEEEKFKKRVVKEESIKLPDPNPEKKANKIINFLSSLLILIIIIFGLYFLMDKGVLPNPFEIKNDNPIIPIDQISTTTKAHETNTDPNLRIYESETTSCSLGKPRIEINLKDNTFHFVSYNGACDKTEITGSSEYDIGANSYKFTTEDGNILTGKFNNRTFILNINGNIYEMVDLNE